MEVRSILHPLQATAFGFTQPEVDALVETLDKPGVGEDLERWYDGYRFRGHAIYNPGSVLSHANDPGMGPRPYWFTSTSDVLRSAVLERGHVVASDFEHLLAGDAVTKVIDVHVVMRDVGRDDRAIWSLLLMSGYVTARDQRVIEGEVHADLVIPNEDVRHAFRRSVQSWVESSAGGGNRVRLLLDAMLAGDVEVMQEILSDLVLATFSVHDTADRSPSGDFPERVYQAFLLGMLVLLAPAYEVKSNRESGYGRYDVAVIPCEPGKPGVVIELERLMRSSNETVEQGLEAAVAQIRERAYAADVEALGASPVISYGIVFDGKRVWVRTG